MAHTLPNGQIYLVSAARTPIGKFGGAFVNTPAVDLGGVAIRAVRSMSCADASIANVVTSTIGQRSRHTMLQNASSK